MQNYSWRALALQRITCKERGGGGGSHKDLIIWLKTLKVANPTGRFQNPCLEDSVILGVGSLV